MDTLLRMLFGFTTQNHTSDKRRDDFDKYPGTVNDDENKESTSDVDDFAFGFNIFRPDDIMRQFEGLFASMEAMTRSMEHELPTLLPPPESFEKKSGSVRDQMLKGGKEPSPSGDKSESNHTNHMLETHREPSNDNSWSRMWQTWHSDDVNKSSSNQDTDLDSVVKSEGLDNVLPFSPRSSRTEQEQDGFVQRFSGIKPFRSTATFASTYSYQGGNGKSESRQTTKDADGNVMTTVTRSLNGETWTEVIRKDPSGKVIESRSDRQSTIEPITRDEDKLEFDSKWSGRSSSSVDQTRDGLRLQQDPTSDIHSIFKNIFGFHLPRN